MSSLEEKYPVLAARAKTHRKAAKMLEMLAIVEDATSDRARKKMLMSKVRLIRLFTSFSKNNPPLRSRVWLGIFSRLSDIRSAQNPPA